MNDLELGSFFERGPWTVDPEQLRWLPGLDEVRRSVRAEVPALVRAKKLPPVGRLAATARHLGAGLGFWWAGARRRAKKGQISRDDSVADLSRRLRLAAEELGPAYIKLGQIISSGEGVFPEPLVAEFKRCRDQVPPETFADVRRVVEEDLGRPLPQIFSRFDETPLAAASIAQVHAATLVTGEDVVVKVQRPDVARLVHADLEVMAWIAPRLVGRIPVAALANPPALVELFAETIVEELDFRLEAENMLDIARSFAQLGQRRYVVPRPHPELVTRRVLVMERLSGFAFDDVAGMRAAGVDTAALVRTGMVGFLEGAMLHGIFHGDLHGGNLFVLPDGRVALLDFGITGRLDEVRRRAFLRLLVGATVNDVRGQLGALRDLGALPPDTDLDAVMVDLRLDRPPVDPTTLTPDELVH
ncbi:MAG TPA: AarF/UbiB family protein, partial [Acidimicrobiia bacterium]|nr:AarF/UbiB family protein [Acidimicrobiia bacterium]